MDASTQAPVRFAIIGCGLIGKKRLASLPPGSFSVAFDVDRSRAEAMVKSAGRGRVGETLHDTIHAADVDAVIVSTLNGSLAKITLQAIACDKHVLVEKPAAICLAQLTELLAVNGKSKSLVRVGYNHRFHPALLKAHELVESGAVGPLMFIRGRYGHGGRVGYDREWRAVPELSGGGELIDQGVHLIDLAGWFLGDFTQVDGHAATYFWDMPVDDNAFMSLRNATGATAWLQVSCSEWKNLFSFEIYGRTGKLQIDGLGGSYGVERLTHYRMLPEMGPPETTSWEYPRGDQSWSLEMAAFLEDIRLKRTPSPGLQEAHAALEVVEKIYRASGYPAVFAPPNMIITRSPLRISLGGGGTDLPSYYREHTGFLIAAAIDKYVYLTLHQTFVADLIIKYSKMERVSTVDAIEHPIIREAMRLTGVDAAALEISSMADIPAGTGLGSSGSFTTALLQALHAHRRNLVHPAELAEQACQIELEKLGEPIGKQDQYIAAFGGITCFKFLPDGRVEAWPLKLAEETLFNLEDNLLLFFTGYSRSASKILKEQDDKSKQADKAMVDNLHFVKDLGYESQRALESGDLEEFARLMDVHWQRKKERSGGMSNPQINDWYDLAMANGALGGKLIGAGGGGFLMFYARDKARLRHAMKPTGMKEVRFRFDFEGTKIVI